MNGQEFKAWRNECQLTQEEAAAQLGVAKSTIQNWERKQGKPIPKWADKLLERDA